jgi:hypothetical protein
MSIEPEDMLEDALRSDLPTPDAQARIRRRLLAAGVAVGNGVATTAAASGVGAGAAASGVATKLAGLSWGLKVGLAAVVAIPTVGLWLDNRAERPSAALAPHATSAPVVAAKPRPDAQTPDAQTREAHAVTDALAATPEPPPARAAKAAAVEAAPPSEVAPSRAHPSQSDFAASEPPPRAPQVGSTLAEETRLLDSAFAELAAGHRARAAELIHEHEARFPAGLLQRERERAKTRLSEMSRGE